MTEIYGIKNCDTMKKAMTWLGEHGIAYRFHDYKKDGVDRAVLENAIKRHGWENVINRRGTTWRKLPDEQRNTMNEASALSAACDNPSLIKRPLLVHKGEVYLGFKDEEYRSIF